IDLIQPKTKTGVVRNLMFTGIHIFNSQIFEYLPPEIEVCINRYAYPRMIENNEGVFGFVSDDFWSDLGTPLSYFETNFRLLQNPTLIPFFDPLESYFHRPKREVDRTIRLGKDVVLKEGATLIDPVVIGDGTVIGKGSVIGPNANNSIAVLGNYNGIPSKIITALDGIKAKLGNEVQVVYEQAINFTNDTLLQLSNAKEQFSYDGKPGFRAAYFKTKDLTGSPLVVQESELNNFWQEGELVHGSLPGNDFSATYITNYQPVKSGEITFELEADDGYRFFINDQLILDDWDKNRWGAGTHKMYVSKDSVYKLKVEYWQGGWKGNVRLSIGNFEKTNFESLANRVKEADAIVFVGGISPQLEGEEMPVNYPGFNGGDRTSILLPTVQTSLMKALKKTGKPLVFVMMTGSAIATPWESNQVDAIVNAWYGGQSAGTAIADVLFGDYNPAGRLPVTFYKSDEDLPPFEDYDMNNRTYRYFKGSVLYPFGYGLSYTSFHYVNLKLPSSIKSKSSIPVSVSVTNTGKRDGEEVVELYISYKGQSLKAPQIALKGFKRIPLKAGESKTIQFVLTKNDLMLPDARGKLFFPKGKLQITVGGGQPNVKLAGTSNVLQQTILLK
ncbi:MAG TPA: glycoside hydrolase family 3 C-terminal domain-containing protein, partial [Niabella sp.]|nr:glycoside hydrolase family 3 C-terminal domain-containing protein [Niabella sp.]